MVNMPLGYYYRDTGDGDIVWYYMNGEPPDGQYVLHDGEWVPMPDGFHLMDRLIDGDPDYYGPVDLPAGVPPIRVETTAAA